MEEKKKYRVRLSGWWSCEVEIDAMDEFNAIEFAEADLSSPSFHIEYDNGATIAEEI